MFIHSFINFAITVTVPVYTLRFDHLRKSGLSSADCCNNRKSSCGSLCCLVYYYSASSLCSYVPVCLSSLPILSDTRPPGYLRTAVRFHFGVRERTKHSQFTSELWSPSASSRRPSQTSRVWRSDSSTPILTLPKCFSMADIKKPLCTGSGKQSAGRNISTRCECCPGLLPSSSTTAQFLFIFLSSVSFTFKHLSRWIYITPASAGY